MPPRRTSRRRPQRVMGAATAGQGALSTWTVTRLRRELKDNHGIEADSWLKKSGLIALLRRAIADHGTQDGEDGTEDGDGPQPVTTRSTTFGAQTSKTASSTDEMAEKIAGLEATVAALVAARSPIPSSVGIPSGPQQQAPGAAATDAAQLPAVAGGIPNSLANAPAPAPEGLRHSTQAQTIAGIPCLRPPAQSEAGNPSGFPGGTNTTTLDTPAICDPYHGASGQYNAGPTATAVSGVPFPQYTGYGAPPAVGPVPPGVANLIRSAGVSADSLPLLDPISPSLRSDILAGKNINLATLLIPGFKPQDEVTERSLVMGEDIVPLKPLTDQRLHRPLTITEFVKAFTIFKKVMCEVYPERHDELDSYLHEIVDMATRYPGLIFYEYHRQFSARAASWLERGVKVNWAVRDTKLFCSLFSGHKANACSVCGNVAHPTDFCPLISKRPATRPSGAPARANAPGGSHDQGGRPRLFHQGFEICNNFNQGSCTIPACKRAHVCLTCKGSHSQDLCPTNPPPHPAANRPGPLLPAANRPGPPPNKPPPSTTANAANRKWLTSHDSSVPTIGPTAHGTFPNFHASQINLDFLRSALASHPDQAFVLNLLTGLEQGFDTGFSEFPAYTLECQNLRSARKDPETVSALLQAELEKGYLIGPFEYPPFSYYRTNPLGLAEKKYSNKKRLILDLSSPHDDPENPSLNNLIPKEEYSLSYVRIDDAIKVIKLLGPNSWLSKTDMVDAFKQVPIHPTLWPLHGLKWDNQYYFFTRLVFGSRSSPKIFDSLSSAICWIACHNYNLTHTLHLLDDFLVIDAPHADADRSMALLTMIFGKLNLPLSKPKTIGPSHCLEYLGITLDTENMQARLPEDKLHRLRAMIASVFQASSCFKIDLLRLLGHLNFAARVVAPGRPFMYRLFRAAFSVQHLYRPIRLTQEAKLDLKMWSHLLSHWNGISLFLDDSPTDAGQLGLFTDASGSIGFGGFFQGRWFQGHWTDIQNLQPNPSIAFKELLPIVIAAILWGDDWKQKKLVFYSDNQATVHILNKKSSRCPFIMRLVRRLVIRATLGNFTFEGRHIAGHTNSLADSLSRFQTERFRRLAPPGTSPVPCPLPSEIMFF